MPFDRDEHAEAASLSSSAIPSDLLKPGAISVRDVRKRFGRYPALGGVSLDVKPGELLALLGPSGSGKTTLLRTIAGLEFPDAGEIRFDDEDVTNARTADRGVGFVFQQYALFGNMTVAKNIAFGLDVKTRKTRPSRGQIQSRVEELLALVELKGLGDRYPSQLSGGQRQRVALARALAVSPRVLLLDEPFGALDATVRKTLRRELRHIHDAAGVATVFVTHDQEEALELADRVAVLNKGLIEQIASPEALQTEPASAFVAGFVGQANRFDGRIEKGRFSAPGVRLDRPELGDGPGVAFVRPEQLHIAADGLECIVTRAHLRGVAVRVEVQDPAGRHLELELPFSKTAVGLHSGSTVSVQATDGRVFPA